MLSGSESTVATLPLLRGVTASVSGISWKAAVTVWSGPDGVNGQLALVRRNTQAPSQPIKREPAPGAALSVTSLASNAVSEQSSPQLMPGPVTVPVPLPDLLTVSSVAGRNVGTAVVFALRRNAQLALVAPPNWQITPVQPVKIAPGSAVARSSTGVPKSKMPLHVVVLVPQSRVTGPGSGSLLTVPLGFGTTTRLCFINSKVAVTVWLAATVERLAPETTKAPPAGTAHVVLVPRN